MAARIRVVGSRAISYNSYGQMVITRNHPAVIDQIRRESPVFHTPPAFDAAVNFLSRVTALMRDIDIAILPVCPSVRDVSVLDENGLTYCYSFFSTYGQWRIYHWATWAMPPPLTCEKSRIGQKMQR